MKRRILIADDHDVTREGLKAVIGRRYTVCGEAVNGQEALVKTIALKPDLVILDVNMPVLNGLDAARQIRAAMPATRILILSIDESPEMEHEVKLAGGDAFLPKSSAVDELTKVIDRLMKAR